MRLKGSNGSKSGGERLSWPLDLKVRIYKAVRIDKQAAKEVFLEVGREHFQKDLPSSYLSACHSHLDRFKRTIEARLAHKDRKVREEIEGILRAYDLAEDDPVESEELAVAGEVEEDSAD